MFRENYSGRVTSQRQHLICHMTHLLVMLPGMRSMHSTASGPFSVTSYPPRHSSGKQQISTPGRADCQQICCSVLGIDP